MKKIAIVTRKMVMGGIEKALVSKLEFLISLDYDLTLYVMGEGGELAHTIPEAVKIVRVFGEESTRLGKIRSLWKDKGVFSVIRYIFYSLVSVLSKTVFRKEWYYAKSLGKDFIEYDLAIAYHTPASFPVVYVLNNINAKEKVAWIHSDVSVYKEEISPYKNLYEKYNHIFCVSKFAMDKFLEMFPNLMGKTSIFYNIINEKKILEDSLDGVGFNDDFRGQRILTVGRLSYQKGLDLIPEILKNLLASGINIRWYIVGEGEERETLQELINMHGLHKDMILLGNKQNPYPYFREADVYVQPSRHEGYCITLAEARIFNKPIVTTNFVGALEQITDNKTGFIVNFDTQEIYSSIYKIITNEELKNKFSHNLSLESNKAAYHAGNINKILFK